MSAELIVAAVLRDALPGVELLDLTLPAGRILAGWPGARPGVADVVALPPTERSILDRFRQGAARRGVFGLADPAEAWTASGPFGGLVLLDDAPPPSRVPLVAGAGLVLLRAATETLPPLPGPERGRIMLMAGDRQSIRRFDLLLPPDGLAARFEALLAAARSFAGRAGGGWTIGGRVVDAQLASLGILAQQAAPKLPAIALPPHLLPHDLPQPVTGTELAFGGVRQMRLLLGALPPQPVRLRLRLRYADSAAQPALFLDGQRIGAEVVPDFAGEVLLNATLRGSADRAAVLGLALPAGTAAGSALLGMELVP